MGEGKRLTVVVGSAGAGKSVLLSSWVAAREAGVTSWLSCDDADADPVRFWTGFITAPQAVAPGFGADAAELLALEGAMSADVTASIANDAARLPAGSAIIVDDFHAAAAMAGRAMTDLVERWPAGTAQLVLAGRIDPPARLHRLRLSGELCELRDHELYLSLAESGALLENFGVRIADAELALLHQRSEGWVAALQMAYLSRGRAVVSAGPLKVGGFVGWVIWLLIHIAFLTGYRNRVGALFTWWFAFTRDIRRERTFTTQQIETLGDVYTRPPGPMESAAVPQAVAADEPSSPAPPGGSQPDGEPRTTTG